MRAVSFDLPSGATHPTVKAIETPKPKPKSGQVLVRIDYAGLSHFDFEVMSGELNKQLAKQLSKNKIVSGIEMAGIAETDGETIRKGDRVVGYANIFKGPRFHADYVTLSENKMIVLPEDWSTQHAAAIIGGGVTVIAAFERIAKLKKEDRVLITGASGAVGILGVQLARHLGADVTATCNSMQVDAVLKAGAHNVFAYDKNETWSPTEKYDVIFDAAPALTFGSARKFLATKGVYITSMPQLDVLGFIRSLVSRRKFGFLMEADTDQRRLGRLVELMKASAFEPVIDCVVPISDATDAFDRILQKGKLGKILLDFRH